MRLINEEWALALTLFGARALPLAALRAWLAENIWQLAGSPSPLDRMMLGEMELALAEFDRGDRDEEYVRLVARMLLQIVNPELLPKELALAA